MSIATTHRDEKVLLRNIPWDVVEAIVRTLGDRSLRLIYDDGDLEIQGVIKDVSWAEYEALLEALGDSSLPHTYFKGELQLMSPGFDHDGIKRLMGRFIESLSLELNIEINSLGSTTLTKRRIRVGIEPDEAYYLKNESKVRGLTELDLNKLPSPDLALEVDVSRNSKPKLKIYAALGIPEVWRYNGKILEFLKLNGKTKRYTSISRSLALPMVTAQQVWEHILMQKSGASENSVVKSFLKAVRQPR